ncbi:hypothetical protein SPRA44_400027 [Serratia proteamaculans]|uniref:hypothetical protein n=1 Tax=Serratia proteamaculans TaxID=28151 RepID=UPI0009F7C7A6|nr:hypothetical protein [Serratia proteamaculans]SMB39738.1 hypothetical protein SPRA44_400027 [Serratia proteamaculans]
MKAVKPLRPSALHRPCHGQGQHHPDLSVLALADMGISPRLHPKPELWQLTREVLPLPHWVNHQSFSPPLRKGISTDTFSPWLKGTPAMQVNSPPPATSP